MLDGILGEMELAALPLGSPEDGPAGSLETGVVVGDDILDTSQAAGVEPGQEVAPMNLRLRQGDRSA